MEGILVFVCHFFCQKAIHVTRGLEIEAGFGVAKLLEEVGGIDGIESFGHREAALVHETGNEILHDFLLHVLEFCLRYVHSLMSLSTALCVQKAY